MSDDEVLALVDRRRLVSYLRDIVALDGPVEVSVLSGGRSNLTYGVSSGARQYVVRRRPLGAVASGAHDMAREHRVLAALGGSVLPVPEVHGYSDDERIVGAPFYVMARVRGEVLHRRADVATIDPAAARALSVATAEVLVRLHAVDVDVVGLASLGRPDGFVTRRIGRWVEQWRRSQHRDHPLVEPLAGVLAASVPLDADATLVHGDYRLGNLLVDLSGQPRVAAVLDWEMSTLGDPLTDLAHLLVYWDRTRGRLTHESQTIAEQPGFLDAAALAAAYAAASGRDLARLDFYLAFEHWRAAIIKEGIYTRTRRPTDADGPDAREADALGATVAVHLEEAADVLGYGS